MFEIISINFFDKDIDKILNSPKTKSRTKSKSKTNPPGFYLL